MAFTATSAGVFLGTVRLEEPDQRGLLRIFTREIRVARDCGHWSDLANVSGLARSLLLARHRHRLQRRRTNP